MATANKSVAGSCFVCSGTVPKAKEKRLVLSCCRQSIHQTCLADNFGALLSDLETHEYVPCPNCHRRFSIGSMIVPNDKFTVAETKAIDKVFVLHHSKACIPMTKSEIRGIAKALDTRGIDSMRHVSYRVFVVGAAFWFPLVRKHYCEWEDVATRLSLGFIYENLSEMRSRFEARKKYGPHKDRHPFRHFLHDLMEMSYENDDVRRRAEVFATCNDPSCKYCAALGKMFWLQLRPTGHVAIPNREHFYDRVTPKLFEGFRCLMNGMKDK